MSHEWFSKILADYSNWLFAWAREAGQNSLDAGATAIRCNVELRDGNTVVEWADNGKGMNRSVLETRFMAVGGSLKGNGDAGGFGVAKLVLAFAQVCYSIRTGFLFVTGRNDEYEIMETSEEVKGLTLTVTMAGDVVQRFTECVEHWVRHTTPNRPVWFYLNGQALRFMPSLPAPASVQDWCSIHVLSVEDNPKLKSGVKVRINGQYMFNTWSEVSSCILVELTGSSLVYLTSNRDGLQGGYRDKLSKLISLMTKDPDVLCDTESDKIELYAGELGPAVGGAIDTTQAHGRKLVTNKAPDTVTVFDGEPTAIASGDSDDSSYGSEVCERPSAKVSGNDLVIMNKTNKPIPHKYTVVGMRPMEWRLFAKWTRIVQACATALGVRRAIRTGWVFSTSARAMHKRNEKLGTLVLLNPCELEGNEWVKGFDTSKDSFFTLVSLAVHELTHITHSYHDEEYASALTRNMAVIFANMALINKAK